MGEKTNERQGYMAQLDGARAIAVLMVVLHHYGIHPKGGLDWGPIGPSVFFMLTGFFITRSLAPLGRDRTSMVRLAEFHFRRLCRLMPALVTLVLLGSALGFAEFSEHWTWHLGLMTNFLIMSTGEWCGGASHLWSLGIQEQFYLLWPLLVIFLPRRWVVPTMVSCIAFALAFRIGCITAGAPIYARWLMLPGSLDSFAAGALVAVFATHTVAFGRKFWLAGGLAAIAAFYASTWLRHAPQESVATAFVELPEMLFISWLLVRLLDSTSWTSRVCSGAALPAIGRLSFGIFIYHTLVHMTVGPHLVQAGLPEGSLVAAGIMIGLSIITAHVSFRLLEHPLLEWSRSIRLSPLANFAARVLARIAIRN